MPKMNPAVKQQLVAALRSGEYKQTRGMLRKGDTFCVLGVLCNLHAQAHPDVAARQKTRTRYMGQWAALPKAVFNWAGFPGIYDAGTALGPVVTIKSQGVRTGRLSALNDNYVTFKQLATAINSQL